jgi:hypothetical protein
VGNAQDAFKLDGTLAEHDQALKLGEILTELLSEAVVGTAAAQRAAA